MNISEYFTAGPFVALSIVLLIGCCVVIFVNREMALKLFDLLNRSWVFLLFAHFIYFEIKLLNILADQGGLDPMELARISQLKLYPLIIIIILGVISNLVSLGISCRKIHNH